MDTAIVWFKNDLRLHDNEVLHQALESGNQILPVYIFDPSFLEPTTYGFPRMSSIRYRFLIESLINLQQNLERINSNLLICKGKPEEILIRLMKDYSCTALYYEEEYADEEIKMLESVKSVLPSSVQLFEIWGKTLYHKDDIPFAIADVPMTSKAYRIATQKEASVRPVFPTPEHIPTLTSPDYPKVTEVLFFPNSESAPLVPGGEEAGLQRLHEYTFGTEQLTSYRWTRNRSLGMAYSSKFSPYLAVGSLSPRTIYETVHAYEKEVKKNASTWWMIFELVWRDYFTFKMMRLGTSIFSTFGYRTKKMNFENNMSLFERWCQGQTGVPFVDAHMRQLNTTGFMSNRGRVNVSSFLVHDYRIDWRWGASYFESLLIDYDVSSNWMNWHTQAFEIWYTNPVHQGHKYKEYDFVRTWIPELRAVDSALVLTPWLLPKEQKDQLDYPEPVAVYSKWQRAINRIQKTASEQTPEVGQSIE